MRPSARRSLAVAAALALAGQAARPASPAAPELAVDPAPLTPYTSGGCYQNVYACYRAHGRAQPGAKVTLTISDRTGSGYQITAKTFAAERDDPGQGIVAGDWFLSPTVTDLGEHGTDPSVLVFSAAVEDASGAVTNAGSAAVTKLSASDGDAFAPEITPRKMPVGLWCRLTGPDCVDVERGCPFDFPRGCSGTQVVEGSVEDDLPGSFGVASEIADVVITITKTDGTPVKEIHSFTRRGTQAFYGATLRASDFESGSYSLAVVAFDARGNQSEEVRSTFTVMPV